jgi:hypothetical protein
VEYEGEKRHLGEVWICMRRWDIAKSVEYAGGGGIVVMWIFRRARDIARGVKYAGGGGTLLEMWNMQV